MKEKKKNRKNKFSLGNSEYSCKKKFKILAGGLCCGLLAFSISQGFSDYRDIPLDNLETDFYYIAEVEETSAVVSELNSIDLNQIAAGNSSNELMNSANSDLIRSFEILEPPLTDKSEAVKKVRIEFDDSSTYQGEYRNNQIHGTGEMLFYNKDRYQGKFSSGLRNGEGTYTWKNKDSYTGEWEKDKMSGEGVYTFANGAVFSGTFENNSFVEGTVKLSRKNKYTITVKDSKMEKVVSTSSDGLRLESKLTDGHVTGKAEIKYPGGSKYSGEVKDGMKWGEGTVEWTNGARYTGSFAWDKPNGQGTYYYSNGVNKIKGNFKSGKPEGQLTYYVSSSKSYLTDWAEGKCVKIYE